MSKAFRAAFPVTVPVLMGYLSIGIAFGLMLEAIGFSVWWSILMSLLIYAGSGQYLCVSLLATNAGLGQVVLLTLILNFRHLFYGLSLIEKFQNAGWRKPYLVFALTDETYALLTGTIPMGGVAAEDFYFAISMLDHCYWILGSIIGSVAGSLITFSTEGVDFAMTALFLVIAVDQWKASKGRHLPALLGAGCALVCLCLFGASSFLIPTLLLLSALLLALRGRLEPKESEAAV